MLRGIIHFTPEEIKELKPEGLEGPLKDKLVAGISDNQTGVQLSEEEAEQLLDAINVEELAQNPQLASTRNKLMEFLAKIRNI